MRLWLSDRAAAEAEYGAIATWGTGEVTDMSYLFCASSFDYSGRGYCNTAAASFNDDITAWDTSGVTDMKYMFNGTSAFDQDLGGWSVAKVTSMYATFNGAAAFDQPIGGWRVDGVTNMKWMFHGAAAFNQPLSNWNVDEVKDLSWMFEGAAAFDQDLGWCVGKDVNLGKGVGVLLRRPLTLRSTAWRQPPPRLHGSRTQVGPAFPHFIDCPCAATSCGVSFCDTTDGEVTTPTGSGIFLGGASLALLVLCSRSSCCARAPRVVLRRDQAGFLPDAGDIRRRGQRRLGFRDVGLAMRSLARRGRVGLCARVGASQPP